VWEAHLAVHKRGRQPKQAKQKAMISSASTSVVQTIMSQTRVSSLGRNLLPTSFAKAEFKVLVLHKNGLALVLLLLAA
jgi:hypothetical protein